MHIMHFSSVIALLYINSGATNVYQIFQSMATKDSVAIRINEKLGGRCQPYSKHCIFKVPNQLRKVNENAYEPQIIAIGPYHRGKMT